MDSDAGDTVARSPVHPPAHSSIRSSAHSPTPSLVHLAPAHLTAHSSANSPSSLVRLDLNRQKRSPLRLASGNVTNVNLANAAPSTLDVDAVVIGVISTDSGVRLAPGSEDVDQAYGG